MNTDAQTMERGEGHDVCNVLRRGCIGIIDIDSGLLVLRTVASLWHIIATSTSKTQTGNCCNYRCSSGTRTDNCNTAMTTGQSLGRSEMAIYNEIMGTEGIQI